MRSILLALAAILALATTAVAVDPPALQVTRYDLAINVDYEESLITTVATMVLRNSSKVPVTTESLRLYRLMTVQSISAANGAAVQWQQSIRAMEENPRHHVNYIELRFATPLAANDSIVLDIRYAGFLAGYVETGMLYVRDRVHEDFTIMRPDALAFPEVGTLSSRVNRNLPLPDFTYDARITVPDGLVVANGGELVGTTTSAGRTTFRYRNQVRAWRMDFAIARYRVLQDGPFKIFYLPGDSAAASRLSAAAASALTTYTKWFGPLKQAKVFSLIEIPDGFGSQADVTAILQTAPAFRDDKQIGQLYHELAHLWLPLREPSSPRFDEGIATFLQYLTDDELNGTATLGNEFSKAAATLQKWFADRPEFASVPMIDYGKKEWTGLSYRVGFLMSAVMYEKVGAEKFRKIVRDFHAQGGGDSEAFVKTASKTARMDLKRLFQDWLYTTRWYELIKQNSSAKAIAALY